MPEIIAEHSSSLRLLPKWRYLVGIVGIFVPTLSARYFGDAFKPNLFGIFLLVLWSTAWGGCWMLRTDGKNYIANHGMFGVVASFIVSWYLLQDAKGGINFALFFAFIGVFLGIAVGCVHKGQNQRNPSPPNDANKITSQDEE